MLKMKLLKRFAVRVRLHLDILLNHLLLSYSVFARSPLSLPQTPLFRSFRSAICNPERSHWMGMPWITYGGPERARKRTLGEREGRSCRIHHLVHKFSTRNRLILGEILYCRVNEFLPINMTRVIITDLF